jgi:hypothetical protein
MDGYHVFIIVWMLGLSFIAHWQHENNKDKIEALQKQIKELNETKKLLRQAQYNIYLLIKTNKNDPIILQKIEVLINELNSVKE